MKFSDITKKHHKELSSVEEKLKQHYHFQTIEQELQQWSSFIEEVSQGYVGLIYDYENDLTIRTILDKALEMSSSQLKSDLQEIIKPIDEEFKNVTLPVKEPISNLSADEKNPERNFWFYRVPKKITEDLSPDLDENGRK